MSSLTDTARVTRILVNVLIAGVISLIIGRVLWTVGVQIYRQLNPPPPPAATVGYGPLSAIAFPAKDVGEISYRLETPDGGVPSFGLTAKVFFAPAGKSNLLALERAKKQASSLGFVFEPEQVTSTIYRWTRTSPIRAVLEMDINTSEFTVDVAWETDPNFLNERLLPNEEQAENEVRNYFEKAGFLTEDLVNGPAKITLLEFRNGKMTEAVSLSETDFIQVDIFRSKVDGVGFLTADPSKGSARAVVSGSRGQGRRIVSAQFKHVGLDYAQAQTYPLISGAEAWQRLVGGAGFVASAPKTGTQAVVRSVGFAFYDPQEENGFVQPIYVFEGDNGFVGYTSAITNDWIAQ